MGSVAQRKRLEPWPDITGELATDAALQLLEMGLAKPQRLAAGTPK